MGFGSAHGVCWLLGLEGLDEGLDFGGEGGGGDVGVGAFAEEPGDGFEVVAFGEVVEGAVAGGVEVV